LLQLEKSRQIRQQLLHPEHWTEVGPGTGLGKPSLVPVQHNGFLSFLLFDLICCKISGQQAGGQCQQSSMKEIHIYIQ